MNLLSDAILLRDAIIAERRAEAAAKAAVTVVFPVPAVEKTAPAERKTAVAGPRFLDRLRAIACL